MTDEFPDSLKLFCVDSDRKFYLGQHAHDFRFMVFIKPVEFDNIITLHAGTTEDGQVLATGKKTMWFFDGFEMINSVTLPPLKGERIHAVTSTMGPRSELTHRVYRFTMDVGKAKELQGEEFEWRATKGNEIQGMFHHAKGYKLVRLEKEGPGGGQGGKRRSRQRGESSDGKEVVAV
ncbi:hypothetical protein F5Y11DRAFT_330018 [Daldinia sp. FL1419]|nr:hypothetical protein F5Y11DRAFT_330018 [Daldinia sp. FL1419]